MSDPVASSARPTGTPLPDLEDFAPFAATDDGVTLRLQRMRTWVDHLGRSLLYFMLVLVAAMVPFILWAASTKSLTVGRVAFIVVALPVLWLTAKMILWFLRLDGVDRIEASASGLVVSRRLGLGRRATERLSAAAIERIVARRGSAKPRSHLPRTYWVEVVVWVAGEGSPLGSLKAVDDADPRPLAAAAGLAARVGVELESAGAS